MSYKQAENELEKMDGETETEDYSLEDNSINRTNRKCINSYNENAMPDLNSIIYEYVSISNVFLIYYSMYTI